MLVYMYISMPEYMCLHVCVFVFREVYMCVFILQTHIAVTIL